MPPGGGGGVGGGALKKGLYGEDLPPRFKPPSLNPQIHDLGRSVAFLCLISEHSTISEVDDCHATSTIFQSVSNIFQTKRPPKTQ